MFDKFKSLEILDDMIQVICALYEQVPRCVRCPDGLSNFFTNTIGVKQGCVQSSTLLGIYIDNITDFIAREGGNRVDLGGTCQMIIISLLIDNHYSY